MAPVAAQPMTDSKNYLDVDRTFASSNLAELRDDHGLRRVYALAPPSPAVQSFAAKRYGTRPVRMS